jgi:hypothetical protein
MPLHRMNAALLIEGQPYTYPMGPFGKRRTLRYCGRRNGLFQFGGTEADLQSVVVLLDTFQVTEKLKPTRR